MGRNIDDLDINRTRFNSLDEFNQSHKRLNRPKKREPQMEEKRKLTIYDYIAETRPADSHFIINKYGKYRRARNPEELAYQLKDFVRTFGDKGLLALAEIHPDRDLIEIECRECKRKPKPAPLKEPQTKDKRIYHNASGDNNNNNSNADKILIFGGLILVAVAILMRK